MAAQPHHPEPGSTCRCTRSASSAPRACSTATTRRSTSCGGSCRARAPRSSTSATTAASARSSTPRSRRTPRASPSPPTRVATSSTSSTSWSSSARPAPATSRSSAVGAGSSSPARSSACAPPGSRSSAPRTASASACRAWSTRSIRACDTDLWEVQPTTASAVLSGDRSAIARALTAAETGHLTDELRAELERAASAHRVPVLGITGTGGSGKSSLTDELVRRLRVDQQDKLRIACVAIDPTRRRGGGALLGDRIRMNSLDGDRIYFRSLATRGSHEVPESLGDVLTILKASGFDLVVVETPGIGQGDAAITSFADVNLYVMTPEFGAASQLEKIDMLDFADVVAINKFERRGAMDALRDVGRQMVRNREAFGKKPEDMPVFGTSAATFNDDGVTALYQELRGLLGEAGLEVGEGALAPVSVRHSSVLRQVVPPQRVRYLAEIAETVRGYHEETRRYADAARRVQRLTQVGSELERAGCRPSRCRRPPLRRAGRPAPVGRPPARRVVLGRRGLLGRRAGRHGPRQGDPHLAGAGVAVRQPDPSRLAPALLRRRRPRVVPASREPPRLLPVHRRRVPVQAGQRGPCPDVRRRRGPVPHQPTLQDALRGAARHAAVDRLRLGDALRPRPRQAPRHLRQGRHVRGLGRHARRHA